MDLDHAWRNRCTPSDCCHLCLGSVKKTAGSS